MVTEHTNLERVVFAFRGDVDGAFKGAHVEYFTVIRRDDGSEIARQPGKATTITDAAAAGFKWADVFTGINTGMALNHEAQAAEIATLKETSAAEIAELKESAAAEIASLTEAKTTVEQERDTALEQVAALQAQLLEYQTPVDENGVPKEVTMRQAQLALLGAGLLDNVEAAIAAIPGDAGRAAQITWTKSSAVQRDNPLINQLAAVLGLTSQQIDALFITAAGL